MVGGGDLPEQRDGLSRTIVLRAPEDGEEAVLAAVRGTSVTVYVDAPGPLVDAVVSDLRRLGTVEVRAGTDATLRAEPAPATAVHPQARALLDLMIDGATLGEAATALHLSRRTADRRLAEARTALGVTTTTAALVLLRVQRDTRPSAARP